MHNEDLIKKISDLHLPDDKYCLVGGAMMQLRGLRPLRHDIDLLVAPHLYNQLKSDENWTSLYDGASVKDNTPLRYIPSKDWEFPLEALHCESFKHILPSLIGWILQADKIPAKSNTVSVIKPFDMYVWKSKYTRHDGDKEDLKLLSNMFGIEYTDRKLDDLLV